MKSIFPLYSKKTKIFYVKDHETVRSLLKPKPVTCSEQWLVQGATRHTNEPSDETIWSARCDSELHDPARLCSGNASSDGRQHHVELGTCEPRSPQSVRDRSESLQSCHTASPLPRPPASTIHTLAEHIATSRLTLTVYHASKTCN